MKDDELEKALEEVNNAINSRFEKIIVLSPAQWINYTRDLVKK